jgi:hypothetical protein
MNGQQRRASPGLTVFNRTAGRVDDRAAFGDTRPDDGHIRLNRHQISAAPKTRSRPAIDANLRFAFISAHHLSVDGPKTALRHHAQGA